MKNNVAELKFSDVLRELDLTAEPNQVAKWRTWAQQRGLELPLEFLEAVALGAGELLTHFSNAERFLDPGEWYDWNDFPVVPLLWENQGNFVFGLSLQGQTPAPVLICHEFTRAAGQSMCPARWQPFAPDFTTFAFARLLEFQYLFNEVSEEADWFFVDVPFNPQIEAILGQSFKRGPTTPQYSFEGNGVRHRFYRIGQRVTVSLTPGFEPYWEISAATKELFDALHAEIKELHD